MANCFPCRIPLSEMLVRAVCNPSFLSFIIKNYLSTWSVPGNTDVIPPTKWHRDSKRTFKTDQLSPNETSLLHTANLSCKSESATVDQTSYWCSCYISSIAGRLNTDANMLSLLVRTLKKNYECGKTINWRGMTGGSALLLFFAALLSSTTRLMPVALPT